MSIEQLRAECERLRAIAHDAPMNKVFKTHKGRPFLGTHSMAWASASRAWMKAKADLDAALSQDTLHSSSVPSMLGVSTAMTTLAAEESVVPNSDPRPTSSPVSEQAGGDRSSPGASPPAAQFPE